jgi:hypothetical protein
VRVGALLVLQIAMCDQGAFSLTMSALSACAVTAPWHKLIRRHLHFRDATDLRRSMAVAEPCQIWRRLPFGPQSESVRIVCRVTGAIRHYAGIKCQARRSTERTEERWVRHSTNGSDTIPCNWWPYPNGFLLPPFDHFEKVIFLNNFNLI